MNNSFICNLCVEVKWRDRGKQRDFKTWTRASTGDMSTSEKKLILARSNVCRNCLLEKSVYLDLFAN